MKYTRKLCRVAASFNKCIHPGAIALGVVKYSIYGKSTDKSKSVQRRVMLALCENK
jgi:hypothetical protein